jgi:hypothetical protein
MSSAAIGASVMPVGILYIVVVLGTSRGDSDRLRIMIMISIL